MIFVVTVILLLLSIPALAQVQDTSNFDSLNEQSLQGVDLLDKTNA